MTWVAQHFVCFMGEQEAHDPQFQHQSLHSSWEAPAGDSTVLSMKLCGSVLCVLLLAIVRPLVGAPTDYASVRAEVVKAYAQQAEEMARALEVLQETSASMSAAAQQIQNACTA